ncbi:serine hydrolase [Sphingomicrobium aestuariivivum]|uniref:serine hydrolase n=1 Tax=Sphingomicrobium aestuariivivum TaxID=1582356 RepID=UPI001FD6A835|nr:serine hydrolase [Sphingomicrobium aestuariivivum]MCJ8189873.1 serine hydrolase [Sphingomicrobium aestuariivivum]
MKAAFLALGLATCASAASDGPTAPAEEPSAFIDAIPAFEERLGGPLGLVLMDGSGRLLLGHRAEERMAFCSSFKPMLAAVVMAESNAGAVHLDQPVRYDPGALPGHSPVLARGRGTTSLGAALDAAMLASDNGATNLMIDALGGPAAVNKTFERWQLGARLDRRETALNENAQGDLRDTSTPKAMADFWRRLETSRALTDDQRDRLFDLAKRSTTGLDRVRAGLPDGWSAGDKTGTCHPDGHPDQQVNDVGFIDHPNGRDRYYFAVMAQRPSVPVREAKAIIAEIGAHFAATIGD